MKMNRLVILGLAVIFFASGVCIAAENDTLESQAIADSGVKEMQWLWGEVVSIDQVKKQITVKYLDYETDNEKEIALFVDGKTAYENIKDLTELKAQDIVSVDYIVDAEGRNLVANVSVEKIEDGQNPPEMPPAEVIKPIEIKTVPEKPAPVLTPIDMPVTGGSEQQ